jgi:hypothetical protein
MVPFLVMMFLHEKNKWRRLWHGGNFILVTIALLSSHSRAGLVAAVAALCVALVFTFRKLLKWWYLAIPAINFAVVLVLLVILCIVGVWQRSNIHNLFSSGDELSDYTVTFEIRKLRSTAADLLVADTALYIEEGGANIALGTLIGSPSVSAAVEYMYDEDGNIVEAIYPEDDYEYLLDVTGKLSCKGVTEEGGFLLGGKAHLAVNQTLMAFTERADFEIRIVKIEKNA